MSKAAERELETVFGETPLNSFKMITKMSS